MAHQLLNVFRDSRALAPLPRLRGTGVPPLQVGGAHLDAAIRAELARADAAYAEVARLRRELAATTAALRWQEDARADAEARASAAETMLATAGGAGVRTEEDAPPSAPITARTCLSECFNGRALKTPHVCSLRRRHRR